MLFETPPLDDDDLRVIAEINELRRKLRLYLYEPKRWKGQMRRNGDRWPSQVPVGGDEG
jgi:hypothetical protein